MSRWLQEPKLMKTTGKGPCLPPFPATLHLTSSLINSAWGGGLPHVGGAPKQADRRRLSRPAPQVRGRMGTPRGWDRAGDGLRRERGQGRMRVPRPGLGTDEG